MWIWRTSKNATKTKPSTGRQINNYILTTGTFSRNQVLSEDLFLVPLILATGTGAKQSLRWIYFNPEMSPGFEIEILEE